MIDYETINLIGIISCYLKKINFDTSIIGFSGIEKHPEKNNGICFSPASRDSFQRSGMRYVVNAHSSFDKNISSIKDTFKSLLSTKTERAAAIKYALHLSLTTTPSTSLSVPYSKLYWSRSEIKMS